MSKKESEFARYERMRKLEKEAEVEKRKALGIRKKGGRSKAFMMHTDDKDWMKGYEEDLV